MVTLSWIRRVHSTCMTSPLLHAPCADSGAELTARRLHIAPPLANAGHMAAHLRRNILYVAPCAMSEDYRSRIKFLASKNHQSDTRSVHERRKVAPPIQEAESDVEAGSLTSSMSVRSVRSASDVSSMTAARYATAREFRGVLRDDPGEQKGVKRVACPKPSALSPYSKQQEELEPATLKNHYAKVLLNPYKPFGVTFPPVVDSRPSVPAKKPRRFEQFLGTANQQPMMSTDASSKPMSKLQNRQLQSTSATAASVVPEADPEADPKDHLYDNLKKKTRSKHGDNRYLEMCTAEHNSDGDVKFIGDPKALRKRHVEVVKMEVIKLDKKLKRSKQTTNINRELEHVLQEALAQSKVYEQNVLGSFECDEYEEEQEQEHACWPTNGYRTLAGRFTPPRSPRSPKTSHTMVEPMPSKASFDMQTRNRTREMSEDGKHCYNVLKNMEGVDSDELQSKVKPHGKVKVGSPRGPSDDSMTLTDLNDYDDGSNKVVAKMARSGYSLPEGSDTTIKTKGADCRNDESVRLSKMERDIKMAQRQHSQRVLDVFDIMQKAKK